MRSNLRAFRSSFRGFKSEGEAAVAAPLNNDPSFDDTSEWAKGAGWSVSGGNAVGSATTKNLTNATQIVALSAGVNYLIRFKISGYVGGSVRSLLEGPPNVYGATVSANGEYEHTLSQSSDITGFFGLDAVSAFTGNIEYLEIHEA